MNEKPLTYTQVFRVTVGESVFDFDIFTPAYMIYEEHPHAKIELITTKIILKK